MKKVVGQTKIESFVEALFSNILSYLIDVAFVLVVAPMLGFHMSLSIITGAIAILYGIHLIKSFVYRRFWNWLLLKQHKRRVKEEVKRLKEEEKEKRKKKKAWEKKRRK